MSLDYIENYITAKPLALEIISPVDTGIISQLPVIQFKLKNPAIQSVIISVGNYKTALIRR